MRPSSRHGLNKGSFVRKFRHQAGRTKFANVRPAPMRGGTRL